jgi:hypothetical protein
VPAGDGVDEHLVVAKISRDPHGLGRQLDRGRLLAREVKNLREPRQHAGPEVLLVVAQLRERLAAQLDQRLVDDARLVVGADGKQPARLG